MPSTRTSRRALLGAIAAATGAAGCLERDSTGRVADERERPIDDAGTNASDPSNEANGSDATDGGSEDADDRDGADPTSEYSDVTETLADEPLAEQFDCDPIERPTPDVEGGEEVPIPDDANSVNDSNGTVELAGSLPYPDAPEDRSDDDALRAFVEDFEAAYQRNVRLTAGPENYRLYDHDISVPVRDIQRRGDVTFVLAEFHGPATWLKPEENVQGATGIGDGTALYAFDATGTARQYMQLRWRDVSIDDERLLTQFSPEYWELIECRQTNGSEDEEDGSDAEN